MMLNPQAVEYARQMVQQGKWALNTMWPSNAPTAEQETQFSQLHGAEALRQWYLATDDQGSPALPVGDFQRVHRSGVAAAKRQAERAGEAEIADAAESILDLFDRINAC